MNSYRVTLTRPATVYIDVTVEAEDEDKAAELALAESADFSDSEWDDVEFEDLPVVFTVTEEDVE